MANQIRFNVGFQVDKTGLNELQNQLTQIAVEAGLPSNKLNTGLQEAAKTARVVEGALQKAFNVNLGTTNISKFNQELKNNNLTIQQVKNNLSQAGSAGANAFNLLGTQILKTNVQLKESNKLLDEMAVSMANTVKWGITSSIFNSISGSIQKAYGYTKNLDSSLNDIRIVTDKSAESMEKFAVQANEAAKGLGASTLDYTQASLIYYQQGLSDEEVKARAETTLKAANVTGQTGAEVSEQLTAVWNGYKVTAQEAELYVDKLAAVAATTAADLEELSTGMSKVASAASIMGVDIDQLNAQLATIVSVTRQAPESVGTALKTIYARMGDIEAGLDTETTLGNYTEAMAEMGFNVLDANGKLRDMGEVVEEIGSKWSTLSREQQVALSQTVAGTRQYNNLLALFDNWDMYTNAIETSANAMGTLQKQQDIYMESTEAKLQELKTTMQSVYDGLIDTDELNAGVDALTNLAQVADNFIGSFGGGLKSIAGIAAVIANIFNKQIANGINNALLNHQKMVENAELLRQKAEQLKETYAMIPANQGNKMSAEQQATGLSYAANYNEQAKYAQQIQTLQKGMTSEEYQRLTTLQAQVGELQQEITLIEQTAILEGQKLGITEQEIQNYYEGKASIEDQLNFTREIIAEQERKTASITEENQRLQENATLLKDSLKTNVVTTEDIRTRLTALGVSEKTQNNILKGTKSIEQRNKVINDLVNKITQKTKNRVKEEQNTLKTLQQQEKVYSHINNTIGRRTSAEVQQQGYSQELEAGIEQQKQSANVLANVTTVSSALSSVAMTWMSVNSLMQTWSDENASFGDKMLQTVMTVGIALPSLISAFSKLNEVTGVSVTLNELKAASTAKNTALEAAGITTIFGKNKELQKQIVLQLQSTGTEYGLNNARMLKNMSDKKAIMLLGQLNKDTLINIGLTEAQADAVLAAKLKQDALNASMLANPLTWIIGLLAAAVGAYAIYTNSVEKAHEAEIERAKAMVDEAEALRTEREELEKLQSTYNNLYSKYIITGEVTNDLEQSVLDLANAYEIEIDTLDLLSGRYDKINQKLLEQNKLNSKIALDKAQEGLIGQEAILLDSADYWGEGTGTIGFDYGQSAGDEGEVWSYLGDYMPALAQQHGYGANESRHGLEFIAQVDSAEEFIAFYEDLQSVYNNMTKDLDDSILNSSEVYHSIQAFLIDNKDAIEDYQQLIEDIKRYGTQYAAAVAELGNKNMSIDKIVDTASYNEYKTGFKTQLEEVFKEEEIEISEERLNELVDNYMSQFDTLSQYAKELDIREELKERILGTSEDIEIFLNQVESEGNLELLATLGIDENTSLDAIKEGYEYVKAKAENDFNQEGVQITISALDSLNEKGDLSGLDEEEQKNFNKFLESSTGIYDNSISAAEEWDEVSKQGLIDQIAYLTKIQELNNYNAKERIENTKQELQTEKEYQEQLLKDLQQREKMYDTDSARFKGSEEMQKDYQDLQAEIVNTQNRLDELNNVLEDSEYWDIQLETESLDYFSTQVDKILSQADALKSAAELIGEGFLVAAEDAQALNDIYPALMENAEVLADGSIQLNQDVVKAIMEGNSAVLTDDSLTTQEQLENKITLLDAEIAYQESKIEALQKYLAGEIDAEELSNQVAQAGAKYEEDLINALGVVETNAAQVEIDNSEKTTNIALQNLDAIGARIEAVSQAYSKMLAGEVVDYAEGGMTAVGGTASEYTESSQVEGVENTLSEEDKTAIQRQLDAAQAELDALLDTRSEYTNLLSKLRSGTKDATDALSGAASGAGGKSDSGKKEERNEEYKNKEDEIDRYWELNKAIEEVTEALSDLDKKQEKLYGKELIASLKAENELLEEQAERYRALAAEQQREANELQGLLSAYGVVFDAQGGVANYLAASQAALDRYNQAVAAYNAFLIDEATFKAEQRAYENFKSLLDRYEALYYEEMRETQNKLDEIHRQELENNLKAWEVEIQLKLDMSEMERQWEDFFKDINENFKLVYEDLDATMENLANKMKTYQGEDGDIATTLQAIKDVQAEIDKMQNGGESDMFESVSQAQEKLKELNEQLQDSALAMKELWEEAWDTYLEGIDQAADQLDDLMERYDNINEQIEYQKELIELLYGEEAYDLMDKYYETQQKNTMSEIDSLKQQADLWKQQYEEALAIDEANGTMSEDTQKFYELWQEAQEELNGKVIDYIDLLQNDYKNAIAGVISDLEKSLTGGSTLDDVKEQWELLQEQADKYYDDVERIYEISNLAGKYETSIANTSELKNQQKLQELYDREMEYLENKKYLTEYDLEVANARYDMALKQIALEEAQQNKNAMKLVRGADSNWSYQYVADEDDIASKQQALLDAANEYYRITKEGYHENLEDMMNAQATYLEKLQEINEIYINDEEMRAQKAQELYEMYYGEGGILTLLYTENEERRTNMADATLQSLTTFYAIDEENYTRMTEVERELIDGLKDGTLDNYDEMLEKAKEVCGETLDAWTSSAQEIANQWYKDGGDSVKAQIIQAYKDMELANKSYQDAVAALEKAVEQNFGEEGITGALNDAQKETEKLDDKTEELCDNAESNLDRYRDAVNQIGEAWEAVKDQIQDAIDLVNEYLNLVGSGGSDSGGGSGDPGSGGGTSPSPGSGGGSGDGQLSVGETVTYTGGLYYYDSNGTAPSGSRGPGKQVKVTQIASGKPYPIHVQSNDSAYGWLKKEQLSGYDTGGYTGDWHGGDGRLALLHSKELVLNANDTENMLAAVNTVRQIANLGDSINQSIMNGISQMILGLTGLGNYGNYSIGETKESGDTIFEIQANFPNANDVESIREAIMSLPNLASQYIARNKK